MVKSVTPGLHGEQFIHYITVSPRIISAIGSFSLTVVLLMFFNPENVVFFTCTLDYFCNRCKHYEPDENAHGAV